MKERHWGFGCVIVLFKREGRVGGWRGDCYFGITIPFIALLLTLFLVGWRSVIGQRNVADVYCLFVIRHQLGQKCDFHFAAAVWCLHHVFRPCFPVLEPDNNYRCVFENNDCIQRWSALCFLALITFMRLSLSHSSVAATFQYFTL